MKKSHRIKRDETNLASLRTSVSKMEKTVLSYVPENEEKVRKTIQHELDVEGVYK
jgi:hypothetical protein